MKLTVSREMTLKLVLTAMALLTAVLYIYIKQTVPDTLKINEISFAAEDGVDWIEIYNPTRYNVSLEDFYLSDTPKNYDRFEIQNQVIIPAGGFVVIYGKNYAGDDENALVANFAIKNGETIYLVSRDGDSVVDSLTAISPDEEMTDFSVGRFADGQDDIFIMSTPTPGAANQKDTIGDLREPIDMTKFKKQDE